MSVSASEPRSVYSGFQNFLINVGLLFLSAVLFALPNPGFIFSDGLPVFAWFAYIPVYILIHRVSLKTAWLYGFFYGVTAYILYVSWLVIFSPVGSIAIEAEHGVMLLITFELIKAAGLLFPVHGWIVEWLISCAYEYAKTKGFAGFSYGVTAYTQWQNTVLIQCTDILGVWGLSALILFVSAWCANVISETLRSASDDTCKKISAHTFMQSALNHWISAAVWALCFIFVIVYGVCVQKDYSSYPSVQVAACQNNTDPWIGGISAYKRDVNTLMSLSDQALASDPAVKLVVWPETAVVPSVLRHYRQRPDQERFELIKSFLEYVDSKSAVFVTGNDHAVDTGNGDTDDYNSVLVFTPKKNTLPPEPEIYRKIHLVPFTEFFPWPRQFPGLYQALLNGDTHLWSPGSEITVFHCEGLTFATPVCFEDTFGDGCRDMYRAGARAFVNLSNDAWSKSLACQNQHLAMAVFRCVENRVPAVRSTASGQTCILDPNGKIVKMAKPFTQTWITGSVPVIPENAEQTLYVRIGDVLGKLFVFVSAAVLLAGILLKIYNKACKITQSRKER